ncbi:MAG: SBBP repeat-containing protein [Acidobacteriota bacterium]|nr:SBBP repeat-containing protein [Blastocatellia bacterium]MDW8412460.1 SBBP repeat-containing protein [Acidobacteriota bacterium]
MLSPQILSVLPEKAVPGGEVIITCSDFDTSSFSRCAVYFGSVSGRIIGASQERVIASVPFVPAAKGQSGIQLAVGDKKSNVHPFVVAERLAENLHPVSNPAIDYDTGSIYVTLSGQMGQKVPVSVWKISADGMLNPFLGDLVNPTAIAFDSEGIMYISSRHDGCVYKISPLKDVEPYARNLGVATGIAFDSEDNLYVGDRQGTIFVIDRSSKKVSKFASLEPSVSAYHLAFDRDGNLYVAGPTTSSFDSIVRIDQNGKVSKFFTGFGRPQGLAFDEDGNLYVVASYRGRRGVYRLTPYGEATIVVAGNSLVGLAFDNRGNMILASTREVFRLKCDIRGILGSL